MYMRGLLALTALLWAAQPVMGQEEAAANAAGTAEEEEVSPWDGKVSFGYLATSGNTESSNLNADFLVSYTAGNWIHSLGGYWFNATESDITTTDSYGSAWKSERNLSEFNFLFFELNYRRDRFSGYPTQFSQSAGYGRRILQTAKQTLNGQIALGARQSERSDGVDEDDVILRGAIDYKWAFSETAEFKQDLVVEYGQNNTYLASITALKARLIGDLALVASYTLKNNSDVPVGVENTDTYTALTLEYAF
jgi:putative salt-induced outer membrane protein